MSSAFTRSETTGHCKRCGRQYREADDDARLWNEDFNVGYSTGLVCPRCQTDTDSLEAEVNSVEMEEARTVTWEELGESGRTEMFMQTIEQRARRVITEHRERAEMAGQTHVDVDTRAWAAEAIDGAQLFKGQPESVQYHARAAAEEVIGAMLGLSQPGE